MKLKCVVNLFGGPGTGKSTTAANLFYRMKRAQLDVELVTEYAKDLTWEKRHNVLNEDQLYIFAKQHRKLLRIKDHVEYAICDSPLILSNIYYRYEPGMMYDPKLFSDFTYDVYTRYPNLNIYLQRNKAFKYQTTGRNQTNDQAKAIDNRIEEYLIHNKIQFVTVPAGDVATNKIIEVIKAFMGNIWDGI